MLKTIGTTALVIVAMLSCGTAQAETLDEFMQSPEAQEYIANTSKEDIARTMVERTQIAQQLDAKVKNLEDSIVFLLVEEGKMEAIVQEYAKLIKKLKRANSGFSDTEKSNRRTISNLENALRIAEQSNSFAEAGAYQNGYDAGAARCY